MDFTTLLRQAASGNLRARAHVIDAVYQDLCRMADRKLRSQQQDLGLTPTDLVHEIIVRLLRDSGFPSRDKKGFFGYVGRAMQNYLIDHARHLQSRRRCGDINAFSLIEEQVTTNQEREDLLSLHEAVDDLFRFDARKAKVVRMKYLDGMSITEVARVLEISEATVKRDWESARRWLLGRLRNY